MPRALLRLLNLSGVALSVNLITTPSVAEPPGINFRRLSPPMHLASGVATEPTATDGLGQFTIGTWTSYGRSPIRLETAGGLPIAEPVEHQLTLDAYANLGILENFSVGLAMPLALYQAGDGVAQFVDDVSDVPQTTVGDLALRAKLAFLSAGPHAAQPKFGLAALGWVNLPTGDDRSYLADRTTSGEIRLLAERWIGPISARTMLGAYLRKERRFLDQTLGSAIPWALGVAWTSSASREAWQRWGAGLDIHGDTALNDSFANQATSPVLLAGAVQYGVEDFELMLGGELPINAAIGTPEYRAIFGVAWAPRAQDTDRDGLRNGADACPNQAEDIDSFQDADGCPEADNDSDGIPDTLDECPLVLGVHQVSAKKDSNSRLGCPALEPVLESKKIEEAANADRCPNEAEDLDNFEDQDGCPGPDNDKDGVDDALDACPTVSGKTSYPATRRGCPTDDADGDTWLDSEDRCPDEPEDFNGTDDGDGCRDEGGTEPLVRLVAESGHDYVTFRVEPIFFRAENGSVYIELSTLPAVRALAQLVNRRKTSVAVIAVRPASRSPQDVEGARSAAEKLVEQVRVLARSERAAEVGDVTSIAAPENHGKVMVWLRGH